MAALPTGVVTFLFTDVEGSTDSRAMTVALMHYLGRGHPFERVTRSTQH